MAEKKKKRGYAKAPAPHDPAAALLNLPTSPPSTATSAYALWPIHRRAVTTTQQRSRPPQPPRVVLFRFGRGAREAV